VSFFSKLRGITETLFQLGIDRAQLKSQVTGELEIRNDTDTGFAVLRVGTPVGANDATTLAALQARALLTKSGIAAGGSFSGNPKKTTITFVTPFSDALYAVQLGCVTTSGKTFAPIVESQLAGSFVINVGTNNVTDLVQVDWSAIKNGEAV